MHIRSTLALSAVLAGCGPQVDPSEDAEATDTEAQASSSESDETSTGSDPVPPGPQGSSSDGTTTSQGSAATDTTSASLTASASASASGGETTDGADISCDCIVEDGPIIYPGCNLDELCDPVVVSCELSQPSQCGFEDLTVTNPQELECHREALLAGEPGFLRWELPYPPDAGAAGQRGWVVLRADQTALFWHESWGLGSYEFSAVEGALLDNEATIADCGALGSPEETLLCLYTPAADDVVTCNEAYDFPF